MALRLVRGLTYMTINSTFTDNYWDCVKSPSRPQTKLGKRDGSDTTQANSCFAFIYTAPYLV